MKKISMLMMALIAIFTVTQSLAQAPDDLSFLTNRAQLASWALKQVSDNGEIEVNLYSPASGGPEDSSQITKAFAYQGPASLTAMALAIKGQELEMPSPIPDSTINIQVALKGNVPNSQFGKQWLFVGGVSGKPQYDGENWRLPEEYSKAPMYLMGNIVIPVQGVMKAWIVETNSWGWAVKKSLQVIEKGGFYFDTSLAGEAFLCLEVSGAGGGTWVYDLRGDGKRKPFSPVLATVSIRDSEDVRDYGDNSQYLDHWVFTYKPENSSLTYGKVPLMVANYTETMNVQFWCGSSVGYATSFKVTRMADQYGSQQEYTLELPEGVLYYSHRFTPGLYHIVPLGIDVCPDWWKIMVINGWSDGKG